MFKSLCDLSVLCVRINIICKSKMEVKTMKTIKMWLEQDEQFPQFKRLAYELVDVPIADVLQKGIHPFQEAVNNSAKEEIVEILNKPEMKIEELENLGYGSDISAATSYYGYYDKRSPIIETLKGIRESIFFVDALAYLELLKIAKEQLRRKWNHTIAKTFLSRTRGSFNDQRSFLKARDKNIVLCRYLDIDNYDLGKILSLEDFEGEDTVIINEGIQTTNFRSKAFLAGVTDERGYLRLAETIPYFRLTVQNDAAKSNIGPIIYNGALYGDNVRLIPELNEDNEKRAVAKAYAEKWREDQGRYCFITSIEKLSRMIKASKTFIDFPSLNYQSEVTPVSSFAKIKETQIPCFAVGSFITVSSPIKDIKKVLRKYGISMTGRKDQLLQKLAKLAIKLYIQKEPEMSAYFTHHRFIKVSNSSPMNTNPFPLLEGHPLRNLLLTMYILKHLRANTILESFYENDTFDLPSLTKSLLNRDISFSSFFMGVY